MLSRPLATGIFRSGTTGRVVELLVRDGQQMASIDGTEIPMKPDSDDVLHCASVYDMLKYSITLVGGAEFPTEILFEDFGNRDKLSVVRSGKGASAQPIMGCYRSDSTETEVAIDSADDGATMRSVGRFGAVEFRLECLTEGVWRSSTTGCNQWPGLLAFDRDYRTLRYTNLRTRELPFRRVR